jgi:hypothetical protein
MTVVAGFCLACMPTPPPVMAVVVTEPRLLWVKGLEATFAAHPHLSLEICDRQALAFCS